jgi:hypothetical protein
MFNGKTSVQAGQPEPPVLSPERDGHTNRWIPVDIGMPVHQAVVAAGAADLHGKDSFIRFDVYPVKADSGLPNYFSNRFSADVREVVSINDDNGSKGASPKAVHGFKCDFIIGSGFAGPNCQPIFELLGDA